MPPRRLSLRSLPGGRLRHFLRLGGADRDDLFDDAVKFERVPLGGQGDLIAGGFDGLDAGEELAQSGFVAGLFAMGEKGNEQVMKVNTVFTSKDKAAPMAMQAQGMLAMAPMMLAGDPTKTETAEEKEMKALAGEFLAGIQPVEASGNQVTLTAKWDTRKLFSMIEKVAAVGAAKANEMPQSAIKK